jgi:uncharacterized protein (DUF58 family)
VHWRSTARYGELMVRREEQQWRNRVLLLLDTRRVAHAGSGATSSFEAAVSAAASIGTHLAQEGLAGELITDTGPITAPGMFEDVLLNSLAVIQLSRSQHLTSGIGALRRSSGLVVAVTGRLTAGAARQLAASRRDAGPAIAVLLDVATWASPAAEPRLGGGAAGRQAAAPGKPSLTETGQATAILRAAGWRVATLDASTPLAIAWQQLALFSATAPGSPAARPGAAV